MQLVNDINRQCTLLPFYVAIKLLEKFGSFGVNTNCHTNSDSENIDIYEQ